jgi:putative hydrolase of the HAD superfamily
VVVTWVVFDYGNVLSYSQPPEAVERLAAAAGGSVPGFSAAYWRYRLDYDRAVLDGPGYWRQVGTALGRSYSAAEVAELTRLDIESWLHLNPAAVRLAEAVAAAGYPLALLSNAPAEVAEAVAALDLAAMFQHCLFSCFLRTVKPEPGIYLAVLDRLAARPGDVVFIDDRAENVTGAEAVGLRPVLFTDAAAAAAALARLGVQTPGIPAPGTG